MVGREFINGSSYTAYEHVKSDRLRASGHCSRNWLASSDFVDKSASSDPQACVQFPQQRNPRRVLNPQSCGQPKPTIMRAIPGDPNAAERQLQKTYNHADNPLHHYTSTNANVVNKWSQTLFITSLNISYYILECRSLQP